jgi:carboxypeptidase family protein
MSRFCLALFVLSASYSSPLGQGEVGDVRGRVVLYNGSPVEGADVSFFLLDRTQTLPTNETLVREVKTDHRGQYEARRLPAGRYRVVVELFGFGRNEVWGFYIPDGAHNWLEIGLAQGMQHDLVTATVSGTVTASSGEPIADATVTLASAYDVGDYSQTRTNSNGRYTLSLLQPGDYVVWATKEGFAASAHAVEIRNGAKRAASFQLTKRGR